MQCPVFSTLLKFTESSPQLFGIVPIVIPIFQVRKLTLCNTLISAVASVWTKRVQLLQGVLQDSAFLC